MMKKIILFMAYFGKPPAYFPIWMKASAYNDTIDFLLITDCREIKEKTSVPNIRVRQMDFVTFKDKVQSRFPFQIKMHDYGRVSQFRPAFGYIFPEEIKGYDFWGFIECDLIPGDIRAFLTDEVLQKHEKFFKLGHFQLYQNTDRLNTLFMAKTPYAVNYKLAFRRNILFFEEIIGMYKITVREKIRLYDKRVFCDIRPSHYFFERSNFSYTGESTEKCLFVYENGKLYEFWSDSQGIFQKKEVLYVHLQKREMKVCTSDWNQYLIVPNKFTAYQDVTRQLFEEINENAAVRDNRYGRFYRKMFWKNKRKRLRNPDWWIFLLIRIKIKILTVFLKNKE